MSFYRLTDLQDGIYLGIHKTLLNLVENMPSPDQSYWVQFSITSPSVVGGLPLSNSLHRMSMSIASDQGEILDWYNFSMRYGYYEGVDIVQGGGVSSIVPGGVLTLETIVRNTGNSIRSLDVEIVALDENGSMITVPGGYFEIDNWSASIIESWRVTDLYLTQQEL